MAGTYLIYTAGVSGTSGTPTGTVTFTINGSAANCSTGVATATLSAAGTATCKWTPSASGTYQVAFTYSGDTTYAAAGPSSTLSQLVDGWIVTTAATPVLTSPVTRRARPAAPSP